MYIAFLDYVSAQILIRVVPDNLQGEEGEDIAEQMADDLDICLSDSNWMIMEAFNIDMKI